MKFCSKCNIFHDGDKKFCVYCGQPISEEGTDNQVEASSNNDRTFQTQENGLRMDLNKHSFHIDEYNKKRASTTKFVGILQVLFFGVLFFLMILALTVFTEYNEFSPGHLIPIGFTIIGIVIGMKTIHDYKKMKKDINQVKESIYEKLNLQIGGSIDLADMPGAYFHCFGLLVLFLIFYVLTMFLLFFSIPVIVLIIIVYYEIYLHYCLPKTKITNEGFLLFKLFSFKKKHVKWSDIEDFEIKKRMKWAGGGDDAYLKTVYLVIFYLHDQQDAIRLNLGSRDPETLKLYLASVRNIIYVKDDKYRYCHYHPDILKTRTCSRCNMPICDTCGEIDTFNKYNRASKFYKKAEKDWICKPCSYKKHLKRTLMTLLIGGPISLIILIMSFLDWYGLLDPVYSFLFMVIPSMILATGAGFTIRSLQKVFSLNKYRIISDLKFPAVKVLLMILVHVILFFIFILRVWFLIEDDLGMVLVPCLLLSYILIFFIALFTKY